MINWIEVANEQPPNNTWILTTYYMKSKDIWRTRIYEWNDNRDNRKITHWSFINTPN